MCVCWLVFFCFGWPLLFEREVTVSTYRKLRINRYLLEAYSVGTGALPPPWEEGALAHTSLTCLVGESKRPVCAGQPLPTQLSLHPGGKKVPSGLAVFSALQNDCNTHCVVITCPDHGHSPCSNPFKPHNSS